MSNASFWSAACSTAMARDESSLMRSFLAISGISIFCSCAIAIASGVMFYYWRRSGAGAATALWKLYGAFAAFICFGSCVRVATWSVYIEAFPAFNLQTTYFVTTWLSLSPFAKPSRFSVTELLSFWQTCLLRLAAWQVLLSVDFLCLCAANLMVLDRMRDFSGAVEKYKISAIARWLIPAVVMSGCVAGVCGSIASAVTRTRASSIAADALAIARMWDDADPSKLGALQKQTRNLYKQSVVHVQEAEKTDSVGNFSEMTTLVLLVACFLVACILCLHRLRLVLLTAPASASAKRLHRQIVITAAVVFFTFLPRAAFSSLKAVAGAYQDIGKSTCEVLCSDVVITASPIERLRGAFKCDRPLNQYSHMTLYLLYTPEFQMLTDLISSLSQLVTLWAMTSERMLEVFRNKGEKEQVSLNRIEKLAG